MCYGSVEIMTRRTKPYSLDFRQLAVQLYESGLSASQVAKRLNCYRTSVLNWVSLKQRTGQLSPKPKGHRKP